WLCGLVKKWGIAAALGYVAIYGLLVALSVPGGAGLTLAGGVFFGTLLRAAGAAVGATPRANAAFLPAPRRGGRRAPRRGGRATRVSWRPAFAPMRSIICWFCGSCRSSHFGS